MSNEKNITIENGILRKKITIINKLGLHARASAKLVKTAGHYTAAIKIYYNDKSVDGKSIMDIIMLGASKGAQLEMTAEGDDATDAMNAIIELVNNRFDETE